MTTISEFVLNFLVNALWQIVAITVVASLGAHLLKHGPARYRHTLWVAALGLCVMLPVWSVLGVAQKSGPAIMPPAGFNKTHDTAPGLSPAGIAKPTTNDQKNNSVTFP